MGPFDGAAGAVDVARSHPPAVAIRPLEHAMNRRTNIGAVLVLAAAAGGLAAGPAAGQPTGRPGAVIANHVFTAADDFVVEVYHNGLRVPEGQRTLLLEQFGASAERVDVQVREGDWLVFNVVNNRLRWGGASYFGVVGRGDAGIAFTTELKSGRWSCCDDPAKVNRFVTDRDYLTEAKAQPITNPWGGGDAMITGVADGWGGTPLWGKTRNTWVKFVAR